MKQRTLVLFGVFCITSGLLLLIMTFLPVIRNEINYSLTKSTEVTVVDSRTTTTPLESDVIVVSDENLGLVIPKIRANASIVSNVDPNNPDIYQNALTKGIAHALGTPLPSQGGNTFLFSHSSSNFFEASRYNSIFYLLSKLASGDQIYIYEASLRYEYVVKDVKVVNSNEVEYLDDREDVDLTLMTCWPAGTDLKRLIVTAQINRF